MSNQKIGTRLGQAVGAAPGAVMALGVGALGAARRVKPFHPYGRVGRGTLTVTTAHPYLDVPLLAVPGSAKITARWSRGVGLPSSMPDLEGLAIRLNDHDGEGLADVLMASTGTSKVGRYAFTMRAPGAHGSMTTLIPVATDAGALMFRVDPANQDGVDGLPTRWDLSLALHGGEWRAVGHLDVEWGKDQPIRFDPVANVLPGTRQYGVVRALREPSYFLARRATTP